MVTRKLDRRLLYWLSAALISSVGLVGAVQAQGIIAVTPTPNAAGVVNAATNAAQDITSTAQSIWLQLTQPPQSDLARLVLIVGGIVLLLAGWLVYEWIILIAGFLIGAATALALVSNPSTVMAILVFLVGGVIGAALGALLYYLAVFLIGAYVGIAITQAVAVALSLTPVSVWAVLIGGIVGGLILLLLSMELLMVLSAIVGAQMIAVGLGLSVGWVLLLALVGVIIQWTATRARGYAIRRVPVRRTLWDSR